MYVLYEPKDVYPPDVSRLTPVVVGVSNVRPASLAHEVVVNVMSSVSPAGRVNVQESDEKDPLPIAHSEVVVSSG